MQQEPIEPNERIQQGLRRHLAVADLRAARVCCRQWARELGALVDTVAPPAALWQHAGSSSSSSSSSTVEAAGVAAALLGRAADDSGSGAAACGGGGWSWSALRASISPHGPSPQQLGWGGGDGSGDDDAAIAAALLSLEDSPRGGGVAREPRARASGLTRLAAAFPAARAVRLEADAARAVDAAAAARALAELRAALPGVRGVAFCRLEGDAAWAAALEALLAPQQQQRQDNCNNGKHSSSSGGACEQAQEAAPPLVAGLTELRFLEASLPGPFGFAPLAAAARTGALRALRILELSAPAGGGRLERRHLEALAALRGLAHLRLAFKAGGGSWAEPLLLDPLGALEALEELTVEFTGARGR